MAKKNREGRMPLADHLKEFRRRFIFAGIGLLIGAVIGWFFYDPVFSALKAPFDALKDRGQLAELNFSAIASSFDVKIRVSAFIGFIISSPWWIFQIWGFINPALTKKERRASLGFIAAAVPLFAAGVYTAWSVIPRAVAFLTMFTPEGTRNLISADIYLKFVMQFLLAFGVAYLLPLFMVALSFIGVVSGQTWLKGWRWAILLIFIFSAAVTPSSMGGDISTMFFMAVPLLALYAVAVAISLLADKRIAKRRAAIDAELADSDDESS